jgi:KamA family protein
MTVVLPQRIDAELCERLGRSRLKIIVVSHCNHAQELSSDSAQAFDALRHVKATLFNQSVILSEVNDSLQALQTLSEALFQQGVLPYYLHLPDAVAGTAHFDVALARAQSLIAQLRAELPGYLVPRLVREEPGNTSKTPYA